jgi:Holliday junction DNA helicase RuvA
MLSYIQGSVVFSNPGSITIGVGSSESRIGYELNVPQTIEYTSCQKNQILEFFLYTHVREDVLQLFGFLTQEEKELFLTLLSVNGIGPKSALAILSAIEPGHLIQAILDQDKVMLQSLPGIGKKTAERLLVELKDKVEKQFRSRSGLGIASKGNSHKSTDQLDSSFVLWNEARLALLSLGYRESDISQALLEIKSADDFVSDIKSGDLIKRALRKISSEMGK